MELGKAEDSAEDEPKQKMENLDSQRWFITVTLASTPYSFMIS